MHKEFIPLHERVAWSLTQKISHALTIIDEFYQFYNGNVYCSFSGGKDSVTLKWFCDKYTDMIGAPRMKCVFSNTTNEHQQILDFVKSFGDEVEIIKPKITFAQSLIKNGFPLISKEQSLYLYQYKNTRSKILKQLRLKGRRKERADGTIFYQGKISNKWLHLASDPIKITNKCCDELKKKPFHEFERRTGLKPITGVTHDEGSLRKQMAKTQMCNSFGDRPQSKPLNIFTDAEIWDVIILNKIPYCIIYDDQVIDGIVVKGEKRTGCAYCAFGAHLEPKDDTRFHRLYRREPKRYLSFMDKLGYRDALHKVEIVLPDDNPYNIGLFKDQRENG